MIWYAILLHWVWGSTLLSSAAPLNVTAISTIVQLGLVSAQSAGIFFLAIASMALIGIFAPKKVAVLYLIPQTLVLWLAAYGAIIAMISGTFADGVVRSQAFLITDQAPAVIAAVMHTLAVVDIYLRKES